MAGLVEEIQTDALDTSIPISSILRKVKLAAAKLQLKDAITWVDNELNGYRSDAAVPSYREGTGRLMTHNPYRGTHPAVGDARMIARLSRIRITESVSSIESLMQSAGEQLILPLDDDIAAMIQKNNDTEDQYMVMFGKSMPASVLDAVRSAVLDWAIKLEGEGILGEGISFSMKEKAKAAAAPIHIGTFTGNLHQGDISGNQNRLNVLSPDHSNNTAAITTENVFERLASAVEKDVNDEGVKGALLDIIASMVETKSTAEFGGWFNRLMAVGSDYITVLTPFLPALTAHLSLGLV